jgi:hypothetical protein
MNGFVHEQLRLYSAKQDAEVLANQVMNYYTEAQVPVLTGFTKEFVTFNNWHSGHPGVSDYPRSSLPYANTQFSQPTPTGPTSSPEPLPDTEPTMLTLARAR